MTVRVNGGCGCVIALAALALMAIGLIEVVKALLP